jgi:opacity protein-like surface antigen
MMKRLWLRVVRASSPIVAAGVLLAAGAARADAQVVQVTRADARHSIGFNLGYFTVTGRDGRVDDDTIIANLLAEDPLLFEVKDFNGPTIGAEWLYGVSQYLEAGVSVGFYKRTVPSIYAFLEHPNGAEIAQDLRLRIVPITATVRFLPLGRDAPVEPYIGGGVGFFNWRYSETGEFVDSSDFSTFGATYKADGTAVGPVVLGGIRFPVGDAFTTGAEFKWQKAEGDTNAVESQLLGDKIDLGRWSVNWTFHVRF